MTSPYTLSPVQPADHESVARLLHRSLVAWYEDHLRAGANFGDSHEPFLLFPHVYPGDRGQACTLHFTEAGDCGRLKAWHGRRG
jgi:hypothetical protein